jgi:signal transduction histidine kinase/ligand-binding sensor domain-containing protein/DNA-binding response OmpR family regulator
MNLKKSITFCITFWLFFYSVTLNSAPRQLHFKHYVRKDGLAGTLVRNIAQDNYGFIWLGSDNGLTKFNGSSFKVFQHTPEDSTSLPANFVNNIFIDSKGRLWVATLAGLSLFNYETSTFRNFIPFPHRIEDHTINIVYGITEDDQGRIIFHLENGNLFYISDDYQIEHILNLELQASKTMKQDNKGNLWITDNNILYKYNIKNNVTSNYKLADNEETRDIEPWDLLIMDSVIYIAGLKSRLLRHNIKTGETFIYKYDFPNSNTNCLHLDQSGNIWVGTTEGLIFLDVSTDEYTFYRKSISNQHSLNSNAVFAVMTDEHNNLWVGTESGLNIAYHTKAFKSTSWETGALRNNERVSAILEDDEKNIWLGYNNGGIEILDSTQNHKKSIKRISGLKPNNEIFEIFDFHQDNNNNIWIGTYINGLIKYNPAKKSFTQYYPDNSNNSISYVDVRSIAEDSRNNLWLALHGAGLEKYDIDRELFYNFNNDLGKNLPGKYKEIWPFYVISDENDIIWTANPNGAIRYDFENNEYKIIQNTTVNDIFLPENTIHSILKDKFNRMWFCTNSGLGVYEDKKEKIHPITKKNGLADNIIESIIEDENGNIWAATNKGISKIYLAREFDSLNIVNYSENDGIFDCEFQRNAVYKTHDGRLLFGNSGGFVAFHPDSIDDSYTKPKILFSSLELFGKKVPVGNDTDFFKEYGFRLDKHIMFKKELVFEEYQNVITIHFSTLYNYYPDKFHYVYKLTGFDDKWVDLQNRQMVTFTNLSHGEYKLEVCAADNAGILNGTGDSIKITVLPAFWKTKLAILLYIFFISLIIFFLRRFAVERQQIKIEARQNELINVLKTKFFIDISHELKTPLTLISAPIKKLLENQKQTKAGKIELNPDLVKIIFRNTNRLLRIIGQVVDLRRIELHKSEIRVVEYDIVEFFTSLLHFFDYQISAQKINLSLKANPETIKLFFDPDKMDKILYNIISNALRYTPEGGNISIIAEEVEKPRYFSTLKKKVGRYILITVTDNGIGIPKEKLDSLFIRFSQINSQIKTDSGGSGLGLSITKDLVELHKGEIEVDSKSAADGYHTTGTSFHLYFIPDNNHFSPEQIISNTARVNEIMKENQLVGSEIIMQEESEVEDEFLNGDDDSKILIIEDDIDIRKYLKKELSKFYQLTEASAGEQGLLIAKKELPSLIICDIMMPGIDGYEVCRQIKTTRETSHIPVILLTARTGEEDEITAHRLAVDAFVKKPFSIRVLLSQIDSIIQNRIKLRESFMNNYGINLKRAVPTSTDEKFIQKFLRVIEENLSNPQLDVNTLTREIGMSRALLYKKVNALTNTSVKLFIRSIRLKKAAELLARGDMNISDVAFNVGFNTLPYFSKCFQEEFGVSPSKYASTHKIE